MKNLQFGLWLIIFVILAGGTACGAFDMDTSDSQPISPIATFSPSGAVLSFETIELVNEGRGGTMSWQDQQAGLLIITTEKEIETVRPFVSMDAGETLSQLDFNTHFAILAFRGLRSAFHGGFRVKQISRQDDRIMIIAKPGATGGADMESSPYHLLKLAKQGTWDQTFTFTMYFEETSPAIAAVSHYVP